MRALTICQPYAHYIATGEKRVENRTWPTTHQGDFLVHAGKSLTWLDTALRRDLEGVLKFGALIARARLVDCVHVEDLWRDYPRLVGTAHVVGPWCWILADVEPFEPVLCNGKQGFWYPTAECLAQVPPRRRVAA